MNELTYEKKIAVLRVLNEIVNADGIIHEKETEYMNEVARSFNLADNYKEDVENMVTLQALSIIKELPSTTKEKIAQLMGKMIVVDDNINYNEVKVYNAVCDSCNIDKEFHKEYYPEYILSIGEYKM